MSSTRRARPERLNSSNVKGSSSPLGATPSAGGVNFSVYSSHATGVELLLFDHVDDADAARVIRIDPADNRTYHYWHAFVPGVVGRPDLRLSRRGAARSGARHAVRFRQGSARSLWSRRGRSGLLPAQ